MNPEMNSDEMYFSMISDIIEKNHNKVDSSQKLMHLADSYLKETMLKAQLTQRHKQASYEGINTVTPFTDNEEDFIEEDDFVEAETSPVEEPALPPARLEASINPDFSTPDDRNRLC